MTPSRTLRAGVTSSSLIWRLTSGKTLPLHRRGMKEYAICPAAPVTQTVSWSTFSIYKYILINPSKNSQISQIKLHPLNLFPRASPPSPKIHHQNPKIKPARWQDRELQLNLTKMQDDPQYKRLLQKSYIMNQYHRSHPRLKIPQVKKQPTIVHESITTGMLTTLIHCLAYPAETVKVRKMAKNRLHDIARFQANKVTEITPYLGFFKGYISILVGNFCFLTLSQQNFFLGVLGEGLMKCWIDMSKVSTQMGNKRMAMDVVKKTFPAAACFSVLRDLTSRGSYLLAVDALIKHYEPDLIRNKSMKYHLYFGSAIFATLVSHPFDLIFTKIASQRSLKYNGLIPTMKTIYKEEGFGKFYSGLDFRLLYNLISIIVMSNSYDTLKEMTIEAF